MRQLGIDILHPCCRIFMNVVSLMNQQKRIFLVLGFLGIIGLFTIVWLYNFSLAHPPNLVWAIASRYYRYDPRIETPPAGLFRNRPEPSIEYFLTATLKACDSTYPSVSKSPVVNHEIVAVEYFGLVPWGFANVHTRLDFEDGQSVEVVFRMMAGHNENVNLEIGPWFSVGIGEFASANVGSWIYPSGLLRDPYVPPPGWTTYEDDGQSVQCNPALLVPYEVKSAKP